MDVNLQLSGGRFVTEAQESKGLNAKTGPVIISSAHAGHSKLLRGLSQFHPAQAYFTGARRTSPGRSAGPNPAPGKGWLHGEMPDCLEIKVLSEVI